MKIPIHRQCNQTKTPIGWAEVDEELENVEDVGAKALAEVAPG